MDKNFGLLSGTSVNSSTLPISTMYGGLPGGSTSPVSSGALASISIPARDGTTYSGAAQQFTIAFSSRQSPTNLIVNLEAAISGTHDLIAVDSGPSGINTATRYYAWPVSDRMYYAHMPRSAASATWSLIFTGVSSAISLADIFIGDAISVDSPIASGLSHTIVDPSIITYADSGRAYALKKSQYQTIDGLRLSYLSRSQVTALKTFSEDKGLVDPFWVALDPANKWDGPAFGASFGAYVFSSMPLFTHDFKDKFTASFSLREAL